MPPKRALPRPPRPSPADAPAPPSCKTPLPVPPRFAESYERSYHYRKVCTTFTIDPTNVYGCPPLPLGLPKACWDTILCLLVNENAPFRSAFTAADIVAYSHTCRALRWHIERSSSYFAVQLSRMVSRFYEAQYSRETLMAQKRFRDAVLAVDADGILAHGPALPPVPLFLADSDASWGDRHFAATFQVIQRGSFQGTTVEAERCLEALLAVGWLDIQREPVMSYIIQASNFMTTANRLHFLDFAKHRLAADPNAGSLTANFSPLHVCVRDVAPGIAKWLIENGADGQGRLTRTFTSCLEIGMRPIDSAQKKVDAYVEKQEAGGGQVDPESAVVKLLILLKENQNRFRRAD